MLAPRVGAGNNLTWVSLVLHLAFPDLTSGWRDEAAGEGKQAAVDLLFSLLEELCDKRDVHRGTAAIVDDYLTWLKAQPWHRP